MRKAKNELVRRILRRKTGVAGLVVLVAIILLAVAASWVAPYDPQDLSATEMRQPPGKAHLLGTDHLGRDILSRVLYGSRNSLLIGFSIALISGTVGVVAGAAAAYFSKLGMVLMRFIDAMMAFPVIILALAMVAITGRSSMTNVIIALVVVYSPRMARTAYGLSLRIKEFTFVEAARALGVSHARILYRHLIPNLIAPIIIQLTFTCAMAILSAASLDFLGVGSPPYIPSWGGMISEGRGFMRTAPWITIFPGLFLAALVLSLNLLGDTLRDSLDPRLRGVL
jgi:peptide/nickel transport system permease protein